MKFMMSTLLTLLAFAFFVCCAAFFAGCAKSVSEPEPEPDPVEVILRHQPPAEKEPLQQEEEERQKEKERQLQREANRKTREEILEMHIVNNEKNQTRSQNNASRMPMLLYSNLRGCARPTEPFLQSSRHSNQA